MYQLSQTDIMSNICLVGAMSPEAAHYTSEFKNDSQATYTPHKRLVRFCHLPSDLHEILATEDLEL